MVSEVAQAYSSLLVLAMSMLRGLVILEGRCFWLSCSCVFCIRAFRCCRLGGRLSCKQQAQQRTHYWPCCQLIYTTTIVNRPQTKEMLTAPAGTRPLSRRTAGARGRRLLVPHGSEGGCGNQPASASSEQTPSNQHCNCLSAGQLQPRQGPRQTQRVSLSLNAGQHSTSGLAQAHTSSWAAKQQARLLTCYLRGVHLRTQLGLQKQQRWLRRLMLCSKPPPRLACLLHPGG